MKDKSLPMRSFCSHLSMRAHLPFRSRIFFVPMSKVMIPACEFSKIPWYFRSSDRIPSANDEVTTPMVTKMTNHAVETATSIGLKWLSR